MTSRRVGSASPQHLPQATTRRILSPARAPLSQATPAARMPSPRPSPAMTSRSPLSPQLERLDPLRPPSPRNINVRPGNAQRRTPSSSLKLPSLPRFHPANFASPNSSAVSTPEPAAGSPQPPMSPRTHQRVISDAHRHLLAHQRDMITARAVTPTNPESPRLLPLGSPGPVTPLQLESEGGDYLFPNPRPTHNQPVAPEQLIDRLIKEESTRQRTTLSRRSSGRQ